MVQFGSASLTVHPLGSLRTSANKLSHYLPSNCPRGDVMKEHLHCSAVDNTSVMSLHYTWSYVKSNTLTFLQYRCPFQISHRLDFQKSNRTQSPEFRHVKDHRGSSDSVAKVLAVKKIKNKNKWMHRRFKQSNERNSHS